MVPYLNRLADLVYTLARWQEGTFRPVRTVIADATEAESTARANGGTVSLTFSIVTTPADRVAADLLAVAVAKAGAKAGDARPRRRRRRRRARRRARGVPRGDRLRGPASARRSPCPPAGKLRAKAAVLVGIGDPDELTLDGLRRAGAAIARKADKVASVATTLATAAPGLDAADAAQAVAEGLALGAYQFLEYQPDATATKLRKAVLVGVSGAAVKAAVARGAAIADAVMWARDIVNRPSKEKPPAEFARRGAQAAAGHRRHVEVLDVAQLKAMRLGGVLGVGQGSAQTPRFLKLTYSPAGARGKPLAFVGKGVVFDSGGLSLEDGHRAWRR